MRTPLLLLVLGASTLLLECVTASAASLLDNTHRQLLDGEAYSLNNTLTVEERIEINTDESNSTSSTTFSSTNASYYDSYMARNSLNATTAPTKVTTYQYLYEEQRHEAPQWMIRFMDLRQELFLSTIEPIICFLLGPVEEEEAIEEEEESYSTNNFWKSQASLMHRDNTLITKLQEEEHRASKPYRQQYIPDYDQDYHPSLDNNDDQQYHRRLGFLPNYVEDAKAFKETSMSFATLMMLVFLLACLFLIFLSCFYHNQKTSPLFSSPRRHRLPKLVPPPLPVDGYFKWVKVCFYLSDDEIIHRVGYDALIFIRFHRLALRCIVKMSVFSFVVLLPLNFTGSGHANAKDLKGYVGSLFFTDFLRFTMANVSGGSPRLWVHCFAAYLLTAIVVRELLSEYETFNSIRHTYLLSREPHLRTVLVTNIPRHLRSRAKINSYFRHVYPQAVQQVVLCQNVMTLEQLVRQRTSVLSQLEKELLLLCRTEKYKLFKPEEQRRLGRKAFSACCRCSCCGSNPSGASWSLAVQHVLGIRHCLERLQLVPGTQERLTRLYTLLESLNQDIEQEQRRRRRVMKMLDRMEAGGDGSKDIDYLLALSSPYASNTQTSRAQQEKDNKRLGLVVPKNHTSRRQQQPLPPTPENDTSGAREEGAPPPPPPPPPPRDTASDEPQQPQEQELPAASSPGGNGSGVLRARSPLHPSAMPSRAGMDQQSDSEDSDNETQTKSRKPSSKMSKAKQKMKSFSRMVGSSLTNAGANQTTSNQSNAVAVAAAEAANDGYIPPAVPNYMPENQDNASTSDYIGAPAEDAAATTRPASMPSSSSRTSSNRPLSRPPAHIEDHLNEVSDKAFVVMQTFTAATIAIQSMHSSRPGSMQVSTAPEPRDILWDNIYISKGATRTRSYLGEVLVLMIITFYVVPIALVSLLVSESALVSSSPRLAQLDQASAFFSSAIAMVQPLCIVGIQQLLPPLFMAIGRAEGCVSFSEVQMRAFSRYFLFQVLNVFLVTTIAGSIFDTIAIIVENPEAAFEMLGNSLPRMSSFFITFVTIKTFLGLGKRGKCDAAIDN